MFRGATGGSYRTDMADTRDECGYIPKESSPTVPVGILVGDVGGGKTTLYNNLCNEKQDAGNDADSCTRLFAKARTTYDGRVLCLYDGPGLNSHKDARKHSIVLVNGLTYEKLNTIFIVIPYQPRINKNIVDKLAENLAILKDEHWNMVIPIITKMDLFKPDKEIISTEQEEERIKKFILEEFDEMKTVLFYADGVTKIQDLFLEMYERMKDMPKRKLTYSESEVMIHFNQKDWRRRDITRLKHMQNRINVKVQSYIEGLHIHRAEHPDDDISEAVFAAIQQNHGDLEDIYDMYCRKYCRSMNEFDDKCTSIELRKKVLRGQDKFRMEAKKFLSSDPDDAGDWRNCVRKCYHCGEVWIKVEGCDGKTQCGANPSSLEDAGGGETGTRLLWHLVDGVMKCEPKKEKLKPESSIVWTVCLEAVKDPGALLPDMKIAIAEVFESERQKVSMDVEKEGSDCCVIRVDLHTRDVGKVRSIVENRVAFAKLFMEKVDREDLILQSDGVGPVEVTQCKKVVPRKRKSAGCGKDIIWRNMDRVPVADVEQFLSVAEIKNIVENITQMESFKREYRQRKQTLKTEKCFEKYSQTRLGDAPKQRKLSSTKPPAVGPPIREKIKFFSEYWRK